MKNFFKSMLAIGLFSISLSSIAEDIDLFVGANPSSTSIPNVMIVLDNAANFSSSASGSSCVIDGTATLLSGTVGGVEQCALYNLINGISTTTTTVNIGMMVYNANNIRDINNANCGGTVGGCLSLPLTPLTAANKTTILNWIKSWKTTGGAGSGYIKASGQATAAAMQETWAYYAGRTGLSGRSYASIKPAAGCQKNYIVFVGNSYSSSGSPGDSTGDSGPKNALEGTNTTADKNANPAASPTTQILNTVTTSCGSFTFPSSAHENKGYYLDEWARYLSGQNFTTYTVGVLGSSCQADYAAILSSAALYGGGKNFPTTNYTSLLTAFQTILSEIQSVASVFASVSLPVSVNTQGTYLNQVYVGMFRPDKDALPRWFGNLKQYKIGYLNGVLQLLDADGAAGISSSGSGFISECARSYWTPTTDDTYWALNNTANCSPHSATSNTPDGNIVEKGGEGYTVRATIPSARKVYTCSPTFSSCTNNASLTSFDTSNTAITQALLNSASGATDHDVLINWARGLNNNGDESYIASTAMRPSVHGDVVHSTPTAINYGTDTDPSVVVFYGGNDGMLRAVNGNRSAVIGTVTAGSELWTFMPPEFYSKIKRLRDNTTQILYKGSTNSSATPKDYGIDGSVVSYKKDSTHAWIYANMRRGGRAVYAFDVSTPASPVIKWKVGCPNGLADDTGCTTGFTGMGLTWSTPKIFKASGYGSGASPMLIMGGGYDTCEDTDNGTNNNSCTASSKGNHIYILDADTGTQLRIFDTLRGVVGDVFVVNDSATGLVNYVYASDMGGNIYRISGVNANSPIGSTALANWTITKIASLGCSTTSTCNANRKFLFGPDVVLDSGIYYLLLGSGDREKPLTAYTATTGVANKFFMVKDDPTNATWLSSESINCSLTSIICMNSLTEITAGGTAPTTIASKGWYLDLQSTEQVVTSAITFYGVVTFSTQQPAVTSATACESNLGTTQVYNINYLNAGSQNGTSSRFQTITGGGLPPSPVAGFVKLDTGETVPFVIGANPNSPLQVKLANPPASGVVGGQPRSRVYWYIQQ